METKSLQEAKYFSGDYKLSVTKLDLVISFFYTLYMSVNPEYRRGYFVYKKISSDLLPLV